ncbi:YicC family protein [Candidatus Dependentiae bacterium]|nr:YicC family protein [Candidatus Dependentiae bacterium]
MILSMTGFSSATLTIPFKKKGKINLSITLKSLNSRFFEVNCKLPFALTHLETKLIKLFKSKLYRGNIFCTVHMSNAAELTTQVNASVETVKGYIEAVEVIQKKFNVPGQLEISDLVSLPHVFELPEEPIDDETASIVLKEFEKLTDQLVESRVKEGQMLAKDIENRIQVIQQDLKKIEARAPFVIEQKKQMIQQTFATVLAQQAHENLDAFIYSHLDKIDIHEEITRAKSHLENLLASLQSASNENGKKIDFILQELFREINTLSAKCADSEISKLAINIKVELEKAREQAQNIV